MNSKNVNKIAHSFFRHQWDNKTIEIHSQCVIDVCLSLVKKTELDSRVFIIAGWIHDLGRKTDKDNHHLLSLKYLDEFLKKHPQFQDIKRELRDCVVNHRSKCEPKTIYGLLFKQADKAALKDKR